MSDQAGRAPSAGVGAVRHADWELPEVLAAVILVAFVILTATGVAVGVTTGLGSEAAPLSTVQGTGLAMQAATTWASPAFAFVLLSTAWLVWWQVRIWGAEIALAEAAGDDAPAGDDPTVIAAFDHLLRAKALATWSLPLYVVVLSAAASNVAGSFLLYRGRGSLAGAARWSQHLGSIGLGLATALLVGTGVVAAAYVRTQVSHEFTLAEEAASEAARLARARSGGSPRPRGALSRTDGAPDPGA